MNRLNKPSRTTALLISLAACLAAAFGAEWQEGASYTAGTTVTYNGHTYQALQSHTTYAGSGWTPSTTPTLWRDLGATGNTPSPSPETSACFPAWSSSQVYAQAGTRVTHDDRNYRNKWWMQGENPAQSGQYGVWENLGACSGESPTPSPSPVTPPSPVPPSPVPPSLVPPAPGPSSAHEVGGYFAQWGIYDRNYKLKDVDATGSASMLTFINYAFGNLYQKNFGENESVNGKSDAWDFPQGDARIGKAGPLKGNFNQLKQLKAKRSNLKIIISLGGWTWSRWFGRAAATDALRKAARHFVHRRLHQGQSALRCRLERRRRRYRCGCVRRHRHRLGIPRRRSAVQRRRPNDKRNYTLLLAEFRKQLDAIGTQNGKRYLLTVAIGAGDDKIAMTEPGEYSKLLDWINVMSYDFHGDWEANGPTDFQAPLYGNPDSPNYKAGQYAPTYNVDGAVKALLAGGVPASKIVVGIPFYGRGWTGVTPEPQNNGLYQKATKPAPGKYEKGIEDIAFSRMRRAHSTSIRSRSSRTSSTARPGGPTTRPSPCARR